MQMFFKKSYIFTLIILTVGLFAIIGVFTFAYDKFLSGVGYGVLYAFIATLTAEIIAQRRHHKLINGLLLNCKTREFISKYEKPALGVKDGRMSLVVMINLFVGYFNLGDFERARSIIFSLHPLNGTGAFDIAANITLFLNLYEAHACVGEYDLAEQALNSAEAMLSSPKLNRLQRDELSREMFCKRMSLNALKGRYEGAEEAFRYSLSNAKSPIAKVADSQMLAICLAKAGKNDEAREHIRFIIENGGDTFYVGWARKALTELK